MAESAEYLLTNAIVLTMDEELNQYNPGAIAISGESILAVGPDREVRQSINAKEIIDCEGNVVMPGLINAHTHVPMTLLRGLADDLRLDVWLMGYIMPVEREFVSPEFVRLGTQLACVELIRNGVTCFADMYYFEEQVAQATSEAGLRALCSQTVLKFPTPDAQSYEESLAAAQEFIQRWKDHPLIVPSVAPHSPYTCTEDILRATAKLAVEYDVPLHTHLAETESEVENSRAENGMPVTPYVKKNNLFDAKVLAAHCVHIDEGEMHTLHHHNAGVAHCPSSNLKLASGSAPVSKMLELGLNVGIGTDGPASNNDLDMFEEIRLTALVAKGITGDPTTVPAATALSMATRLGARAMHMEDMIGTLDPGKRADLIIVDLSTLHNTPRFHRDEVNVYSQLVYSAKSSDVKSVMVNGCWLMRDQVMTTLDQADLILQADEYAHRIDSFLVDREKSVLSKLVAIGGAMEGESFEVQVKVRIPDPNPVLAAIKGPGLEILYSRHYHEYDVYFMFDDPTQGILRYREDEYIDENDEITNIRYRLTMIGPTREAQYESDVLLSRSRYIAPATHSLRFYREYFNPSKEVVIEKHRLRWRVLFQGTEFYINLDRVDDPQLGHFLEVKSRTWSRRDAEHKALLARDLMEYLSESSQDTLTQDYVEIVTKS
jgi:5-methylthioadenosine/S-adenosylhomocysteine deaminase